MTNHVEEFRAAMSAAGLRTDDQIIDDGVLHRFQVDGDKPRTKNGWYTLHSDGIPAGAFGSWKHDISGTWSAKSENEFTPDERKAHAKRMDEARREREAEQARVRAEAQAKAQRIWAECEPANDNHPYLQRKGVRALGIKQSHDRSGNLNLVVPIKDMAGTIHSLQFIQPDGQKRFLTGGAIAGHFAGIGKLGKVMHIAEGYATAASIHEATGDAVAIAFNAGNLEPVAKAVRERFPDVEIVICADNDVNTPGNPGMTKAHKAAQAVHATVVAPEAGDFNDMALAEGLDAVANVVTAPMALPVVANDNHGMVDYYAPLPYCNARGKPLGIIENLYSVIDRLGINIRYNVIKKEDEILIPSKSFTVDNAANASLAWLRSECVRFQYPTDALSDYVTYVADQNLYNPVMEWVQSKPWDGVSRLQDLYDTIDAEDNDLKCVLMKRWMISAMAAAAKPDGVSAHGVLTLQGDQYLGKTKWFKTLVPDHLKLLKDGMLLQPHDKDSVKQVCSFWLVELGELDATFRKSDIAALKSFITNQSDVLRRAYARKESHFARRTVFFASVNPKQFLHDATGNRRYWTIEAKWIDHSHCLDMQQIWAEVLFLYNSGEPYYLQPDEMDRLNKSNEEFTVVDPIHERLLTRLNWLASEAEWTWKTATDVLQEIGMENLDGSKATKAAMFIRQKNGGKSKRSNGATKLFVPPVFRVHERW